MTDNNLSNRDTAPEVKLSWYKRRAAKLKKFAEMNKNEKIFRIVNIIIPILLSLVSIIKLITILASGADPDNRFLACFGVAVLPFVPLLLELLFKFRLSNFMQIFFFVYIFFAAVLGNVFYFYKYLEFMHYDKIMHSLFGYVGCILGLYISVKLAEYEKMSAAFVVLVCFAVSMALGACWEIFEFSGDVFLNQTSQGFPVLLADGSYVTPVNDTMGDIVCNFFGALVFVVHYIVHRATKKNLLVGSMVKDFTFN